MPNNFVKVDNKIYPKDLIESVSIQSDGYSPVRYNLIVTIRPYGPSDNSLQKSVGYGFVSNRKGTYKKYEKAQKALDSILDALNYQ